MKDIVTSHNTLLTVVLLVHWALLEFPIWGIPLKKALGLVKAIVICRNGTIKMLPDFQSVEILDESQSEVERSFLHSHSCKVCLGKVSTSRGRPRGVLRMTSYFHLSQEDYCAFNNSRMGKK